MMLGSAVVEFKPALNPLRFPPLPQVAHRCCDVVVLKLRPRANRDLLEGIVVRDLLRRRPVGLDDSAR